MEQRDIQCSFGLCRITRIDRLIQPDREQTMFAAPHFQDHDKAREYLEALRWAGEPFCAHCGTVGGHYATKDRLMAYAKCAECGLQIDVTKSAITLDEPSYVRLCKHPSTHLRSIAPHLRKQSDPRTVRQQQITGSEVFPVELKDCFGPLRSRAFSHLSFASCLASEPCFCAAWAVWQDVEEAHFGLFLRFVVNGKAKDFGSDSLATGSANRRQRFTLN
jgi:hypothetical protein